MNQRYLFEQKNKIHLESINRILIIFWGRVGELTPATVLLDTLRKSYPKAHITCVVSGDGVKLLENNPNLNEVIEPDISIFRKIMLRDPYDVVIDLHYRELSRKIAWLSGAKHCIWYESTDGLNILNELGNNLDFKNITERERAILDNCYVFNKATAKYIRKKEIIHKQKLELDRLFRSKLVAEVGHLRGPYYRNKFNNKFDESVRIELSKRLTVIEKMLSIQKALGLNTENIRMPRLYLSKSEENFANRYIQKIKSIEENPIVGFHPGGHVKLKLWPKENYAALADKLIKEFKATILIFQGPAEKKIAGKIGSLMSCKSIVVPKLDIRKYMAIISKCDIFVTGDGGPMHIAPALGIPTVSIFMYGDAHYWFPYNIKDGYVSISSKRASFPKLYKAYLEEDKKFIEDLIPVDKVFRTIKKTLVSLRSKIEIKRVVCNL